MKSVLEVETKKELLDRIENLRPDARAQWGKMNVDQMICHLTDQLRDLHGTRAVKYEGNFITKFVVRPILSKIKNWPKGIFPAASGYDQLKNGTKPTNFADDKKELIKLFKELNMEQIKHDLPLHPAFGKLSRQQYARIVYQHFDHHLKQFGV